MNQNSAQSHQSTTPQVTASIGTPQAFNLADAQAGSRFDSNTATVLMVVGIALIAAVAKYYVDNLEKPKNAANIFKAKEAILIPLSILNSEQAELEEKFGLTLSGLQSSDKRVCRVTLDQTTKALELTGSILGMLNQKFSNQRGYLKSLSRIPYSFAEPTIDVQKLCPEILGSEEIRPEMKTSELLNIANKLQNRIEKNLYRIENQQVPSTQGIS